MAKRSYLIEFRFKLGRTFTVAHTNNHLCTSTADAEALVVTCSHPLGEGCDSRQWIRITNDQAIEMNRESQRFERWMKQGVEA